MRIGRLAGVAGVLIGILSLLGVPAMTAGGAPPTELTGTVREAHGDDFAHDREEPHVLLDTGGGSVELRLAEGETVNPGTRVRVRGAFRHGELVVPAGGVTEASTSSSTTTAAATAVNRSVAVLLFNFSNDTSEPWTTSAVRGVVFDNAGSVNAFYQEASDGQVGLAGDVLGWYTIGLDNSGCKYTDWATAARNAATAAGVNLSAYQYLVYAFPSTSSCGWAGLAYLPGTGSWVNGEMTLRVVGHELGHNFGVHHASTLSCTESGVRVALSATSSSCTASEYGDPFAIMGSGSTRLHHGWHKAQLGWLPDVQTVTASGTYTLGTTEGAGTPRLLRVPRNDGTYLQLDVRQPVSPFDTWPTTDPEVNGVGIRIAPEVTSRVQSKLLDATPATTSFGDSALAAGRTFTDPVTGVQITTVSAAPSGATVQVTFPPDLTAPTAPANLSAAPQSTTSIRLTWSASTDNVAVAGYRIWRGATLLGTTTSTSYADSGLSPATSYTYTVKAYDAAGLESLPSTASATTFTPDTQAPSPAPVLTASARSGRASLSWTASSDNVGVAGYRVLRDGVVIKTVTGTSTTDRPARGSHSYQVIAYDAAGNVAPSNVVSVVV